MEKLARKYNGKVVHVEVNPEDGETGEQMSILVFGALGSSPFQQEERALRCMQELSTKIPNITIGAEEGDLYISDTSRTKEHGGALLTAVRTAYAKASDHELGTIRLGPRLMAKFEETGIKVIANGSYVGKLALKGLGSPQITTTHCEGMTLPETESRYVRTEEVEKIAAQIIHLNQTSTEKHIHLDIKETEEHGLGLTRILKALARELRDRDEQRMETALIPNFRETGEYSGVAATMKALFPNIEEFQAWMEKTGGINTMWINLYKELQGEKTESNLRRSHPARTERILSDIFSKIGDLCVICEDFEEMDELSKSFFKKASITLISTGAKETTEHSYYLKGIKAEEITAIAKHTLKGNPPTTLRDFIKKNLGNREGLYNPSAIEMMIKSLMENNALHQRSGSWHLDPEKAPEKYSSLNELLKGIVNKKLDSVRKNNRALTLLKAAITLHTPCDIEELKIADPNYTNKTESFLVEQNILKERVKAGDPIMFEDAFFAGLAREELKTNKKEITSRLRVATAAGNFPTTHYLEVCGQTGEKFTSETIALAAEHALNALDKYELARAIEICGKMLDQEELCNRVKRFERKDLENIFSLHSTLIETKLLTGHSVKEDQKALNAFLSAVHLETRNHEDLEDGNPERAASFSEVANKAEGMRKRLAAQAAFVGQNYIHQARCVKNLEIHSKQEGSSSQESANKNQLVKARLFFREADQHKGDPEKKHLRVQTIDSAITILEELNRQLTGDPKSRYAQEVKRDLIAAQGYKLSGVLLTDSEKENFGRNLKDFCEKGGKILDQYAEKYGKHEWFLEAKRALIQPLAMTGQMNEAIRYTEELIKTTRENGFIQLNLKGVNFLLNLREMELGESTIETMQTASNKAEAAYKTYTSLIKEMSIDELEMNAQTIVASHLTRLEWIVTELAKLAEVKTKDPNVYKEHRQTSIATIMRGQEAIKTLQTSCERYGGKVSNWDGAINKEIETFNTSKERLQATA